MGSETCSVAAVTVFDGPGTALEFPLDGDANDEDIDDDDDATGSLDATDGTVYDITGSADDASSSADDIGSSGDDATGDAGDINVLVGIVLSGNTSITAGVDKGNTTQ